MKLLLLLSAIFIARANSFYKLPPLPDVACNDNETSAKEFLDWADDYMTEFTFIFKRAYWVYDSNITDENEKVMEDLMAASRNVTPKEKPLNELKSFCWDQFTDKDLVRYASLIYVSAEAHPDLTEAHAISDRYRKLLEKNATVCKFEYRNETDCKVKLILKSPREDAADEDDYANDTIKKIMQKSRNYEELLYYWKEWRKLGDNMRNDHLKLVKLYQNGAKFLGFKNLKERWNYDQEDLNFPSAMQKAYSDPFTFHGETLSLEKLYKEIHSFVKGKLIKIYNKQGANIKKNGRIPAHLLGGMFAQNWEKLFEMVQPFPDAKVINVTTALIEKQYKPGKMFKAAEELLVSLGFEAMGEKFWKHSIFEKPKDRKVSCQGVPWDMLSKAKDDYRLIVCAKMKDKDFDMAFSTMAEVAYMMLYRNQRFKYKRQAITSIQTAIGDMLVLAVNTPSYLQHLGLLEPEQNACNDLVDIDGTDYKKRDINYLMKKALKSVVFLPYALTLESWRWDFFSGKTNETNLNGAYWKLRNDLQGLEAPVPRNETNLDAATIPFYGASINSIIPWYVSHIARYQIHEALCKRAGEYNPENENGKPLHSCDFTNVDANATKPLRNMMEKGWSVNWTVAMEEATGIPGLSGQPIVKYFLPLYKYLKQENLRNGITPWN